MSTTNHNVKITKADTSDVCVLFPVDDPEKWFKVLVPLPGDWPRIRFFRDYNAAFTFAWTEADTYGYGIEDQTVYDFRTSDGRRWADLTAAEVMAMADEHKKGLY